MYFFVCVDIMFSGDALATYNSKRLSNIRFVLCRVFLYWHLVSRVVDDTLATYGYLRL